ncbi:MAG: phenylacetate-CoA oxygenase subunit PaaJ [Cytophagaceae bacterium]|nr:phenylacetate-CoA oxygenase subunit PaaJ [Gemmatimonadaceae bacterium]
MSAAASITREQVLAWLEDVKDPEVPVLSVVELGVVRDVLLDEDRVTVEITPTYSGCPALQVMEEDIIAALATHGVHDVKVRIVFREAWTTAWMSDEAREKLRAYGIAPPLVSVNDDTTLVPLRRARIIACPRCGSHRTVLKSEFGSTACKSIHACLECREPFDHFKDL